MHSQIADAHTIIESDDLLLVSANITLLNKVLQGDEALSDYLGVGIAQPWTQYGSAPFEFVLKQIRAQPKSATWWNYLPILKKENLLVGSCGYRGAPQQGLAEIGYEVAEAYRGQGIATAIARLLIDHAFSFDEVDAVLAHTLSEPNASTRILEKCGFQQTAESSDPDEGSIWQWKLKRSAYTS